MTIICSHCGQDQQGSAGTLRDGRWHELCHPDKGMDCYRLVTVYGHQARDCPCVDAGVPAEPGTPGVPF